MCVAESRQERMSEVHHIPFGDRRFFKQALFLLNGVLCCWCRLLISAVFCQKDLVHFESESSLLLAKETGLVVQITEMHFCRWRRTEEKGTNETSVWVLLLDRRWVYWGWKVCVWGGSLNMTEHSKVVLGFHRSRRDRKWKPASVHLPFIVIEMGWERFYQRAQLWCTIRWMQL